MESPRNTDLLKLPRKNDPRKAAYYIGGVGHPDRKADEQSKLVFLGIEIKELAAWIRRWKIDPGLAPQWQRMLLSSESYEARSAAL